jgi:hypothetical protein
LKTFLVFFLCSFLPLAASSHLVTFGHQSHGHQTIEWNGSYTINDSRDLVFSAASFLKDRKIPYQSFSAGIRSPLGGKYAIGSHAFFDMKRFSAASFGTSFEAMSPWADVRLNCYLPILSGYKPSVELIGSVPVHNSNVLDLGARYVKSKGLQGLFGFSSTPFSCKFGDLKLSLLGAFGSKVSLHKTLNGGISFNIPLGRSRPKTVSRMKIFEMDNLKKISKKPKETTLVVKDPIEDSYIIAPSRAGIAAALGVGAYLAKWYFWDSREAEVPIPDSPNHGWYPPLKLPKKL